MTDFNLLKMNYELFCAEQIALNAIEADNTLSKVLTESNDIVVVNEDLKATLTDYINKVIAAVQKAWDNLKQSIDQKAIDSVINANNMKYLQNANHTMYEKEGFEIPDYAACNTFLSKEVPAHDANSGDMDGALASVDAFMDKYFKEYTDGTTGDNKKDFKTVVNEKLFKVAKVQDIKIDSNKIKDAMNFLKSYKDNMDTISKDIEAINKSSKADETVISAMGNVGTKTAAANASAISLQDTMDIYFNEADTPNAASTATTPAATTTGGNAAPEKKEADPGNKATSADTNNNNNGDDKKDTSKDNQDKKNMITYYTSASKVLSTKMAMLNKIMMRSVIMCKDFITTQDQKVQGATATNAAPEANNNGGNTNTNQVKV